MTERIARLAEDEDLPVIEHIRMLKTEEANTTESIDPFAQTGEVVKSLSGTTPNFKRKVTNDLKKYNQSVDRSASSKQITDFWELTGYDAFGVVTPPHSLEGLAMIYEMSAPHYAAVNAKVDNIVGLGFNLVETPKTRRGLEELDGNDKKLKKIRAALDQHKEDLYQEIEDLNDDQSFTEILSNIWRDYEVTGNGYIEIGRKRDGTIGYIGHVPAQTIRVRRKHDGFVQIAANRAQFFRNFGDTKTPNPIGGDNPNELIHIKRYSPTSSYYGVPDIVAAQQAIAGNEFIARFNLEFFENKAVPRHLITLKGANLGVAAQADLLSFFETGLKGQNHRSLFIPLPADDGINKVEFKIEAVDAKIQEASFVNYSKSNRNEILMAHRVPLSKVNTAEGASLAIAKDADKTFKEMVCGPQQKVLEKKLNRIVKEMTDAFELKLNEMTLTDENTQSQIFDRYRKDGVMTGNEVRMALGMPTIKGGDELFDLNAKAAPAQSGSSPASQTKSETTTIRQRDSARSAGATDTNGEARNPKGDGRTTP